MSLQMAPLGAAWLVGACSPSGGGGDAPFPSSAGGQDDFFSPRASSPAAESSETCAAAAYRRELLPSNLLFVVDRSGSMNCNLPPATDSITCENDPTTANDSLPTKWSTILGAMSRAFTDLSSVPNTAVGVTFFSNDDACGVHPEPNVPLAALTPPQISALNSAFENVTPQGGTPFTGAVVLGYQHLHQQAMATGNRFVVLVTDGADSCLDKYADQGIPGDALARLIDVEVPKAISVNIRTFVIGAPGSETSRGLLSKLAFVAGTAASPTCDHESADPAPDSACHFDMTTTADFAADLTAALQSITGRTAAVCEFDLPTPTDGTTVDPTRVNVDYFRGSDRTDPNNSVKLYRDDTLACDAGANGWQYTASTTRIRVCGPPCADILADEDPEVAVSLGCEQRIVIR